MPRPGPRRSDTAMILVCAVAVLVLTLRVGLDANWSVALVSIAASVFAMGFGGLVAQRNMLKDEAPDALLERDGRLRQ